MSKPINIQMSSRIHVSAGRESMTIKQIIMPNNGIAGTKGTRKAPSDVGIVRRMMRTPAQTNMKAKSVPMLVISPATLAGTKAARRPTTIMKSRLLWAGVW